jgi:imidazolonepropionase-like amidohydrolase
MKNDWFPADLPPDVWLRNARIPAPVLTEPMADDPDGLVHADLHLTDGHVAAIAPAGTAEAGIDLDDGQVWPAFVDESVHIAQLDHPFGDWAGSVTSVAVNRCGFAGRGRIARGALADIVLFRARSMNELLSRPQADRVVLRRGCVSDATPPDFREIDRVVGAP